MVIQLPRRNIDNPISRNRVMKINFVDFTKRLDNPSDPNTLVSESIDFLFGGEISKDVRDALKTQFLLKGQSTDLLLDGSLRRVYSRS